MSIPCAYLFISVQNLDDLALIFSRLKIGLFVDGIRLLALLGFGLLTPYVPALTITTWTALLAIALAKCEIERASSLHGCVRGIMIVQYIRDEINDTEHKSTITSFLEQPENQLESQVQHLKHSIQAYILFVAECVGLMMSVIGIIQWVGNGTMTRAILGTGDDNLSRHSLDSADQIFPFILVPPYCHYRKILGCLRLLFVNY